MKKNSLRNGPDSNGYYGEFGSRYAPEILMPNLIELEKAFNDAINDKKFINEFEYFLLSIIRGRAFRYNNQGRLI